LTVECRRARFFFFSSRRRHTRSKRDWSSDVCSSDLPRGDVSVRDLDAVAPCASTLVAWTVSTKLRSVRDLRPSHGRAGVANETLRAGMPLTGFDGCLRDNWVRGNSHLLRHAVETVLGHERHMSEMLPGGGLQQDRFPTVRKGGYDKAHVDDYYVRMDNQFKDLRERLQRMDDELEQYKRDLAIAREKAQVKPEHEQISERMAEILRIAEEEGKERRSRAEAE